jgi:hypothetical protein
MNFYTILAIFSILTLGIFTLNSVYAQIDPLSDIVFLQTGELNTDENQFQISNDIVIREFFNGKIVRVSGHTIEGFPYITYSEILDEKIDTDGIIFINGEFVDLSFEEKSVQQESDVEKKDDLAIVVQYTSHVFSKKYAYITMKIFDEEQNKLDNFNQKDGRLANVNIDVLVLDGSNQEFFSNNGTTDDKGFFEARFWIPDNYKRDEFMVTIDAENENSKSSKILQLFTLGNEPKSSVIPPP